MLKNSMLKTLLKFTFAIAIIAWMLRSGKLDLSLVNSLLENKAALSLGLFLIVIQGVLAAIRFRSLLKVKVTQEISLVQILRINWIGYFFSSFLPGAVTGDLVKLIYIRDIAPGTSKSFLFTTALIDRVFGLVGLLAVTGVSSLLYYQQVLELSPKMKGIIFFNLLLFAGSVIFVLILFLPKKSKQLISQFIGKIPKIGIKIQKLIEQFWSVGNSPKTVLTTLALSILIQFSTIFVFWVLTAPFYSHDLSLPYILTLVPIGLITIAIPISPAGLGVGHAVFANLFELVHISNGASLFNLYFLCAVFINLLGIFAYLSSGKKHNLQVETEELEHSLEKNS